MIRFEEVSRLFGAKPAVERLSLEVKEGTKMILLGTSGCGKTTTLRMANRLIEPTTGAIFINSQNVTEQQPEALRRGIGYVLQHNSLFPHFTVAENIAIVPNLLKWPAAKIKGRIDELLAQLRLPEDCKDKLPAALSGGQQQRVNVARALAANPPILLMDEPFGALDPLTRAGVRKEFLQLEALKQKTVLMVTHDVEEAFEMGDRICLMHEGKVVQTGTPSDLLFHPQTSFVSEFLSGQMLSLSLKTIRLRQLIPYLQATDVTNKEQVFIPDQSMNEALEWMTSKTNNNQPSVLYDAATGQQWKLDGATIWNAFHKYQQNNQ